MRLGYECLGARRSGGVGGMRGSGGGGARGAERCAVSAAGLQVVRGAEEQEGAAGWHDDLGARRSGGARWTQGSDMVE
jgi:hypothetical protein